MRYLPNQLTFNLSPRCKVLTGKPKGDTWAQVSKLPKWQWCRVKIWFWPIPHWRVTSSHHPCYSSGSLKYILIQNQLKTARFKIQLLSSTHPWKDKHDPPGILPWILLGSNLKPRNDNYLFLIPYRLNLKCFWILIIRDCQEQGCGKSHTVIFPFLRFPKVSILKSATYAWERLSILLLLTHISVCFLGFSLQRGQ